MCEPQQGLTQQTSCAVKQPVSANNAAIVALQSAAQKDKISLEVTNSSNPSPIADILCHDLTMEHVYCRSTGCFAARDSLYAKPYSGSQ